MQSGGPSDLARGGQLSFDVLDAPAANPPAAGAFDDAPLAHRVVSVLIPLAVEGPYSYRVPRAMRIEPGSIVQVPLGTRSYIAAVWDDAPDLADASRLKDIEEVFDAPPLAAETRRFVDWVADYTLTPRGMGHVYAATHYLDGWVAVTAPAGWTESDLARLRTWMAERDL